MLNFNLSLVLLKLVHEVADPVFNGVLHYQPLFDFELVLIVARQHRLARCQYIEPSELQQETILAYPVIERERLDMFRKVL